MRLRTVIGSKRKCVFLLSLYLSLSGFFLLIFNKHKLEHDLSGFTFSKNNEYFLDILRPNVTGQKWFDQKAALIKDRRRIDTSHACFSNSFHELDDQMMETLYNKEMLHYFRIQDQYTLSVPNWQSRMKNSNSSNKTGGKKYYVASVIRVRLYTSDKAKWTVRELKQWLHYQFWAGSEHVYICMHYLHDEEKFDKYLTKYIKHGLVTVYPWTNITAIPGSKTYEKDNADNQISCYNHVLKHHGNEAVWHYNFDLDENPYVPTDQCEGFLTRFLKKVNHEISEFRLANYVMAGQGDRSRDIFYDRINRMTPKPRNGNVKPIYRLSMTNEAGMHGCKTTGKLVYPVHSDIKLLHYWGAREQDWKNDTEDLYKQTVEFNTVRNSLAIHVRHSLIAFGDIDVFSANTGP